MEGEFPPRLNPTRRYCIMSTTTVLLPLLFVLIFMLGRNCFARYDSGASWKWAIGIMMASMVIAGLATGHGWLIVPVCFVAGMVTKAKHITIGW